MKFLRWYSVFCTASAFYSDVVCSVAFYKYYPTLSATIKNGGLNKSYINNLFHNAQLLPILNFYILGIYTIIAFVLILMHLPLRLCFKNVKLHKHYIQHFAGIRILYLVVIGMYYHHKDAPTNRFTIIFAAITSLTNLVFGIFKIAESSQAANSPDRDPSFDLSNITWGYYMFQLITSLFSFALCISAFTRLIKEEHRKLVERQFLELTDNKQYA